MKSDQPKIHLISYATPQFRRRQIILGLSARLNGVVNTVTAWSPQKLNAAGFEKLIPDIGLDERGVGFWSWKPFIIQKRLSEVSDGEIVLYCDVGRIYPFKLLDQPITPYLRWMEEHRLDVMPGIEVPWYGPIIQWTKRDALVAMGMDISEVHCASPLQASFSIWRGSPSSRAIVSEWMELCRQRHLISDDPSTAPEHPEFQENRHDQALWSLLCIKRGIPGVPLGVVDGSTFDAKNPCNVSRRLFGEERIGLLGRGLRAPVALLEWIEKRIESR